MTEPVLGGIAQTSLVGEGKAPAEARPELMGITKASLATDSWLSAASIAIVTVAGFPSAVPSLAR